MNKKIFLIGTSHSYQKKHPDALDCHHKDFFELISDAVKANNIRTIGEEMSQEALGESKSLCQIFSQSKNIHHVFCDPSKIERNVRELPVEDCPSSWSGREKVWLEKLTGCEFPVLFVCGANHINSFSQKCSDEYFIVTTLERDWRPVNLPPLECRNI